MSLYYATCYGKSKSYNFWERTYNIRSDLTTWILQRVWPRCILNTHFLLPEYHILNFRRFLDYYQTLRNVTYPVVDTIRTSL